GGMGQASLAGVVDYAVGADGVYGEAVDAVARDGGGHVEVRELTRRHRAERRQRRPVDRRLRVPRHRQLVPAAVRYRVDAPARDAPGVGHVGDLELQVGAGDVARADAAHADAEEGMLHAGGTRIRGDAVVHEDLRFGPEVR